MGMIYLICTQGKESEKMSNGLYLYILKNKLTNEIKLYVGESKRNLLARYKEHEILKSEVARMLFKRDTDVEYDRKELFVYSQVLSDIQAQRTRRTNKETMTMALLIKLGYDLLNKKQMKSARQIASDNSISYIKNVLGNKIVSELENILEKLAS